MVEIAASSFAMSHLYWLFVGHWFVTLRKTTTTKHRGVLTLLDHLAAPQTNVPKGPRKQISTFLNLESTTEMGMKLNGGRFGGHRFFFWGGVVLF